VNIFFQKQKRTNLSAFYYLTILFGLVFITSFFVWKKTSASEPALKITAIQFSGGTGKADEDFIEITNTTDEKIAMDDYRLVKKTSSGKQTSIKSFGNSDSIPAEGKFLWACSKNGFAESIGADVATSTTISESNGIAIILGDTDSGTIIDSVNWGESKPEEEEEEEEEEKDYSSISINEIYPAPSTKIGEEEFVEILNLSEEKFDFSNWIIKDSKGAKEKISKIEKEGRFIVFYGSFSLNNDSKGDEVFLYDGNNNLIDSQKYSSGKSQYSYSFDGSEWRWTSLATPGEENIFDKILSGKIIRDDKIYKNTHTYFDVKTDKDAKKFTWDFGDGHKSYLKSTKHKYVETGKFQASLKITGNGEDALHTFEVKVEKYDAPKVRIISLSPNPKGSDTKNEWVEIKNESKKKINLKGWSLATGWKNLVNHPIREDFEIKAGKTKKLLRDICAFTLVNTKDKIELRSPDGKAVQKIKYDHGEKSIAEDELYSKVDDNWIWIKPQNIENKSEDPLLPLGEGARRADEGTSAEEELTIPNSEIQDSLGKYTLSPTWQKRRKDRQLLAYSSHAITLPEKFLSQNPQVLGAKTAKTEGEFYVFTWDHTQKHWFLTFLDSNWTKLNYSINKLLLKI
jgi:hypothetical protein